MFGVYSDFHSRMKVFLFVLLVALFTVTTAKPFLDWEDWDDDAPVATTVAPPKPRKTTTEAPPQTTEAPTQGPATTEAPTEESATTEAPTEKPNEPEWIKDIEKIVKRAKEKVDNGEDEEKVFQWAKKHIVRIVLKEFQVEEFKQKIHNEVEKLKEEIRKIHKKFEEKITKEVEKFKKDTHQKGMRIMKELKAALKKHGLKKFIEWIEEAEKKAENKAGHEASEKEWEGEGEEEYDFYP